MAPDSSSPPPLQGIERTLFPQTGGPRRTLPKARFLRNTWYVVSPASELPEGKIVHRTILNEPLAFYRKEDGGVAAIRDVCPHRFVPLSMGTLLPGDRVQCIYHGLEFGADGKCMKNPHGSKKVSSGLDLPSYTVVEKHKLLWIWMGDRTPEPEKIPDYSCLDNSPEEHVTRFGYLNVKAHYHLLVDNLLDLSHISFTHAGILGNADTAEADPEVTQNGDTVTVSRNSKDAEMPGILKLMGPADNFERGDQWQSITWYPASNLFLEFGASRVGEPKENGTGYFALHWLTPETDRTTHYYYCAARWGVMTDDEQNKKLRELIYKMRTFAFADQDVPVIEAQQVSMDTMPSEPDPQLLSVDAGPNRYVKILEKLLAEEN